VVSIGIPGVVAHFLRPMIVLVAAVVIAGCSSGAASPAGPTPPVAATPSAPASNVPSASQRATSTSSPGPSLAPCPNPEGGLCLGPIAAGTYTTVLFQPALTYTVRSGWANLEDTPGNFLLLPPGFDLPGVNAGTSDFIGVYTQVALDRDDCTEGPAPGIGFTPAAIGAALTKRAGLVTTEPEPVSIGGLDGVVLDIQLDPKWTKGCFYAPGVPLVPILEGRPPSGLEHNVIPAQTMRLYLLEYRDGSLAIEVNDVATAGSHLGGYSDVVTTFDFAS
jgi:hypothetical protein